MNTVYHTLQHTSTYLRDTTLADPKRRRIAPTAGAGVSDGGVGPTGRKNSHIRSRLGRQRARDDARLRRLGRRAAAGLRLRRLRVARSA